MSLRTKDLGRILYSDDVDDCEKMHFLGEPPPTIWIVRSTLWAGEPLFGIFWHVSDEDLAKMSP